MVNSPWLTIAETDGPEPLAHSVTHLCDEFGGGRLVMLEVPAGQAARVHQWGPLGQEEAKEYPARRERLHIPVCGVYRIVLIRSAA